MATPRALPSNFPRPPTSGRIATNLQFPDDLLADGRNFFTQIQMVPYDWKLIEPLFTGETTSADPVGGVVLPIPTKLNNTQVVHWEEVSLMSQGAALASSVIGNLFSSRLRTLNQIQQGAALAGSGISVLTGYQLNPMLFMMFKQPGFREFTLTWTLSPNNARESEAIVRIEEYLRINSLPTVEAGGLLYGYPNIAMVKLFPNNKYTIRFKPCAIMAVSSDLTPQGPSFFKNGAPTLVNFTLHIKEIDLWTQNNFYR
jgi:hypothetical protein